MSEVRSWRKGGIFPMRGWEKNSRPSFACTFSNEILLLLYFFSCSSLLYSISLCTHILSARAQNSFFSHFHTQKQSKSNVSCLQGSSIESNENVFDDMKQLITVSGFVLARFFLTKISRRWQFSGWWESGSG